ncbi:MAG: outer membrane lipoprotein-sorting protein [Alphaproteobacteria bacterium]|jgi:hypothetical protein|nr:outer membrane lipoprotein-sorting protein [Alphaproteobacteria bacterium]
MIRPAFAALLLVAPICGPAWAETAEEKGLRIATEADAADTGFGDSETVMTMTLRNRHGDESVRHFRSRTLEVHDDGDKSVSVFDRPRDVKGTAVLTFSHAAEPDDQWLYLPALKRVKRISSTNVSGSFVGSEFAFEDLGSQELAEYTYRWLADEPCPGAGELSCHMLERFPVDEHSGYTRQVAWLDEAEYRAFKIDYYDRKNAPLKTLTLDDHRQYLGRYWRAHRLEMVNLQTGKSTALEVADYQFQVGLTDRDFDQKALKRVR